MQEFAQTLKSALYRKQMSKDLKLEIDPWENFLAHDSQHFLPLINHREPISIHE